MSRIIFPNIEEKYRQENWYALFVVTGEEENVKERLLYRFGNSMKIIVPKRKLRERKMGVWKEVIRVLFPGYVLLYGKLDVEAYYKLKQVPGLLSLLKSEKDPLIIEPEEMEIIRQFTIEEETIGYSSIFIENGKVTVIDGPLSNMEGHIISVDQRKGRAKVCLSFMGEERTVDLGITVLQPAE